MATEEISYKEFGPREATTVFLFHGAYGDGGYFVPMAERLASDGYRVVVWDCPGYGDSEGLDDPGIEAFAQAASGFVDRHAGPNKNILLGHSMGALIAPLVANMNDKIDAVILSAGSAGFASRSAEDQERYLAERLGPIKNDGMTVSEYVAPLLVTMMGPLAAGDDVELVKERILAMSTGTFVDSIEAITRYDGRPALKSLRQPTFLLAGEFDTSCPPAGMEKMRELVEGSRLEVLPDVGHYGFAESPAAWHSRVVTFLEAV